MFCKIINEKSIVFCYIIHSALTGIHYYVTCIFTNDRRQRQKLYSICR